MSERVSERIRGSETVRTKKNRERARESLCVRPEKVCVCVQRAFLCVWESV